MFYTPITKIAYFKEVDTYGLLRTLWNLIINIFSEMLIKYHKNEIDDCNICYLKYTVPN